MSAISVSDFADLKVEVAEVTRSGVARFSEKVAEAAKMLVPNIDVDIAEWCFDRIEVPKSVSDRSGPMDLSFVQRFIAKQWQTPGVKQVTNIKITRQGSSMLTVAGLLYNTAHMGRDSIFFERSEGDAQDFHDKKLAQIIEASPKIRALKRPNSKHGVQDSWTDIILKNGASIQLRSASNDGSFRGIKGSFLALDEVGSKEWRNRGKNQEGSKVTIAVNRAQEFSMPMVFVGSSPTTKGECVISEEFSRSNQHNYFMRCPCCDPADDLIEFLPVVRKVKDRETVYGGGLSYLVDDNGYPNDVWYECQQCGNHLVEELHKEDMLASGEFRCVKIGEPGHIGVYTWGMHSEDPQMTWLDIAKKHRKAEEEPASELQPFVNTVLGQPFEAPVDRLMEMSELQNRIEPCGDADAPAHARFLYAGLDVQDGNDRDDLYRDGRVEMLVYAAGRNKRRTVIDRIIISKVEEIDPDTGEIETFPVRPMSAACEELIWKALQKKYRTVDGRTLRIRKAFIDSNWMSHEVTEFCAKAKSQRLGLRAIKSRREGYSRHDFLPAKEKFTFKNKKPYLHLGTQAGKDSLFQTLVIPPPGPNSWTFHSKFGTDDAFFRSMLAEHKVSKDGKTWMWERIDRNETGEVWDMMVYAYAAELWDRREVRAVDDVLRQVDSAVEEAAIIRDAEIRKSEGAPKSSENDTVNMGQDEPQDESEPTVERPAPPRFGLLRRGGRVDDAPKEKPRPAPEARSAFGPVSQMPGIWGA